MVDKVQQRKNVWGEDLELPLGHQYSMKEEFSEAKNLLRRWSEEWKERKVNEMEIFNGKKEIGNDAETASSVSQSRVSNKAERA